MLFCTRLMYDLYTAHVIDQMTYAEHVIAQMTDTTHVIEQMTSALGIYCLSLDKRDSKND